MQWEKLRSGKEKDVFMAYQLDGQSQPGGGRLEVSGGCGPCTQCTPGQGLQPGRASARVPALPGLVLPLLLGVGPRHFLMPSSSPADQTRSLVLACSPGQQPLLP